LHEQISECYNLNLKYYVFQLGKSLCFVIELTSFNDKIAFLVILL